jgi:hypothetical protein
VYSTPFLVAEGWEIHGKMNDKLQKELAKAIEVFKGTSTFKNMSQVCPAASLIQAFSTGWIMRSLPQTKTRARR